MRETSKIKVLEVIRQGSIGGGESHLLDLIECLDKDRYDPVCLSFSDGEMISRLRQMGVKCYIMDSHKPFDVKFFKRICDVIKKEGIQIIHAHGSRAASNVLLPMVRYRIPFVYTVHGWSFHNDQSFLVKKLRAFSEKVICHFASDVICVSKSNADTGKNYFGLRNAHVIENGINIDRYNPDLLYNNIRSAFGFSESDFVIGFIARCTIQKNPIVFLHALKYAHENNPYVKGLFIGEGDMDDEVDSFIYENQMQGYVFRSAFRTDVPDLLQCIDVYCLPSLWEGLSIALLEAMAMRKAIIATPTDGTKELITHEKNGLIVPFNDILSIVKAIDRFFQDRSLMTRCCIEARQLVTERFNAQRVADSVSEIYLRLIQ